LALQVGLLTAGGCPPCSRFEPPTYTRLKLTSAGRLTRQCEAMVDLGNVLHGVGGSAGDISLPAILGVFVQEAGIPLPLPISAVLLLIGYQEGSHPLLVLGITTLLLEVASVLGTSVKYWFGLKGGRPFLHTYGRYVRLKADRIERSEQQFRERGTRAVIVGRLVPGLSMVTPLAAGALGMPYRRFLPAVAAGSAINIAVLVLAGFWAGPAVVGRLVQVGLSVRALATLGLLLAVTGTILLLRRQRVRQGTLPLARGRYSGPFERALIAGLLAMFGMGVGVNLLLYAMTALGLLEPQEALVRFVELTARLAGSGSAALAMLLVLFVVGGAIWSLLYTLLAVRVLPGPPVVRGLIFSVLPLAASMGLLWSLGFGFLGLGLGAGLMPLAGEATRCALFGAGLAKAEDMVRRAGEAVVARQAPEAAPG